jgi:hypothetical protein
VTYESGMWVRTYDAWVLWEGTRYGTYAANWTYGTRMPLLDVRVWLRGDVPGLGLIDEDVGLLRVVDCDILTQGLIGLIEYSYHQGIPSFSEAHLQRTLGLRRIQWRTGQGYGYVRMTRESSGRDKV